MYAIAVTTNWNIKTCQSFSLSTTNSFIAPHDTLQTRNTFGKMYCTPSSDPLDDETTEGKPSQSQEAFLEASAQDGASTVRRMSVEERTKRAMLAEAAEDRMVQLSDDLDELLGEDGLPKKVEYRDEVITVAKQIQASQDQYRALVNGESSPLLDALNGNGEQSQ
jgi:hypothetical protein